MRILRGCMPGQKESQLYTYPLVNQDFSGMSSDMRFAAAVAETGKLYAPNVVRIMSAGTCELYTRNELGLNPNDFVYWSITYITA